ncbi:MAG: TolB family protein [Sporichthyaceae bacterium]
MTPRRRTNRWATAGLAALVAVAGVNLSPGHAEAAPHGTARLSVDGGDREGNASSFTPALSADGRWVAFVSEANNLVPGDTNGRRDIFVRDTGSNATVRVSVDSRGVQANHESFNPSISADGRFVAFDSFADNLVPGDRNGRFDVFLHDRRTGETRRVSTRLDGGEAHGTSGNPVVSGDGRFVAFESGAPDMRPGGAGHVDVFVWDRETERTEWVGQGMHGTGSGDSGAPAISHDGRFVAFTSSSPDLVPGDTNEREDIFLRDRELDLTRRVSLNSVGGESNHDSDNAAISADGRYVAFVSQAYSLSTLDPLPDAWPKMWDPFHESDTDPNGASDVFVHDMLTGRTELVSVALTHGPGRRESYGPAISADGRRIAFASYAEDLVAGDTNEQRDVFVRDLDAATTTLLSVGYDGSPATGLSYAPAISADGERTVFASEADNLVADDANGSEDVFLRL